MKGLLFLFLLVEVPSRPAMIIGKRSVDVNTNKKCLTSPGYPNNYPDNSDTKHTLSVTGEAIEITWSHFDVEAHYTCNYDYLEFFDGNGNPVFKKFCGNTLPPTLTIPTSTASVVFHSDGSVRRKGFKFCYETGAPVHYLSSPNYPRNYPNNQDTTQTMSVENGAAIRVTFHDFQIENQYSCGYDYVQFCHGKGQCGKKMCGRDRPKDFTIPASKATVVFYSDYSVTQRGFLLSYIAVCTPGAVNSAPCFCEDVTSGSGELCTGGERCNKDGTCIMSTTTTTTSTTTTTTTTKRIHTSIADDHHIDCFDDPFGKGKCPENAGCFLDELGHYGPVGQQGFCQCFLGFYPDTSSNPPTCIDMRNGGNCDENGNGHICYQNDKHWEWCPYCIVNKHHEDHGGNLNLGHYVSGEGDFYNNDPQLFRDGDNENCPKPRETDVYYYCWYYAYDDLVPLDSVVLVWNEWNICQYSLYVYTPLACCFADPTVDDAISEC